MHRRKESEYGVEVNVYTGKRAHARRKDGAAQDVIRKKVV